MALLEEGEQRVHEIALGSEYYLHFWQVGRRVRNSSKGPALAFIRGVYRT